jgi:hypothetical protein
MVDPFYANNANSFDKYFVYNTLKKIFSVDCLSEGVRLGFITQ